MKLSLNSADYLELLRFTTQIDVVSDVAVVNELFVGVILAVRFCLPVTGGFHEQVAVKLGELPAVDRAKQLEIFFPPRKNRTFPATSKVTVIVVSMPLLMVPVTVGAPIVEASFELVTVSVRVCASVNEPSDTVITTTYTLFTSLSAGASKSGFAAKVKTPLDELMAKSAASVPDVENESDAPASTSVAA